MRRRHFRRLPRYRPYHGSLPSPFFVLRNKKKKILFIYPIFSLVRESTTRLARNPFCPKLFTSPTHSSPPSKKNTAKVVQKIILNVFRGRSWSREFTIFITEGNDFYFIFFSFLEKDSAQFMNFPREFCRSIQESVTQEPSDETGGAVEK